MEKQDVLKLSKLSRIEISDNETEDLAKDLSSILDYVGKINEVVGEAGEPEIGEVHNVFREDTEPHESGLYTKDLLDSAPNREGDYFKVKKIL